MPGLEPYLLLNGVELVNVLRTQTYLRRGLAGRTVEVHVPLPLAVPEGTGYSDIYGDIYGSDPFVVANLACYCALFDTGPYARPSFDPAPWYDPRRPESEDFLGLWAEAVITQPASRTVTPRSSGGGQLSALAVGPRAVQVQGTMYAGSRAGAAYGQRWLTQLLAGTDSCEGDELVVLPTCPPDTVEDPTTYLRTLQRVGLVDPPVFSPMGEVRGCVVQQVAFQLLAADPYLRSVVDLLGPVLATTPVEVTILAPALVGDAAAVVTLGGPMTDTEVTATIGANVVQQFTATLAGDEVLVVDSSTKEVRLNGGLGGLDAIDFDGLMQWAVAPAGTTMMVTVHGPGTGTVQVQQVNREL